MLLFDQSDQLVASCQRDGRGGGLPGTKRKGCSVKERAGRWQWGYLEGKTIGTLGERAKKKGRQEETALQ